MLLAGSSEGEREISMRKQSVKPPKNWEEVSPVLSHPSPRFNESASYEE